MTKCDKDFVSCDESVHGSLYAEQSPLTALALQSNVGHLLILQYVPVIFFHFTHLLEQVIEL